jgi:hypothetical protein
MSAAVEPLLDRPGGRFTGMSRPHFWIFVDFMEIENFKHTRKTKFSLSYGRGYAIFSIWLGTN